MKLVLVSAALIALAAPAAAQTVPPAVAAAVADTNRPEADRDRDAARKPADFVAFTGIKAGDKVADFIMGGGYWTRILSNLVGANGRVYAYQPAEFIQFRAAYGTEQDAAAQGRSNVVATRESLGAFTFAEPLDAIVTVQNWHDLHLNFAPPGFAASVATKLFGMLKPGGTLIVADNASAAGTGFTVADSLHRAEGSAVRAELEAAGFVFEAASPLWTNAADPKDKSVFDPSIRGRADQFIYRFRKPA